MSKCEHIWQKTTDQSDTGKIGIRKHCRVCGSFQTFIKPTPVENGE